MISVLDSWRCIVPSWVLVSVVEQLVMPRLCHEVEAWDPLTDTVPVHEWLHPWIPFAKDTLSISVYPVIRRKLSCALTAWHPSDRSAHLMLKPWQSAFPRGDMDAFLLSNILPKLQTTMQELIINPHQQHLGEMFSALFLIKKCT
jgi:tuftelin-interacting protein 11